MTLTHPLILLVGVLLVLVLAGVIRWAIHETIVALKLPIILSVVLDVIIVLFVVLWAVRYLGLL
jgi:hypothetical protein